MLTSSLDSHEESFKRRPGGVSEEPREDGLAGARMSHAHCPDHLASRIFEPEVRGPMAARTLARGATAWQATWGGGSSGEDDDDDDDDDVIFAWIYPYIAFLSATFFIQARSDMSW